MGVKLVRVIWSHQIRMLAMHRQTKLREAAKQLGLSLHHTKRLAKELRGARGDFSCLLDSFERMMLIKDQGLRCGGSLSR